MNYSINNPIQKPPLWSIYPVRVDNPEAQILYQFAIGNSRYSSTAWHHPGIDFFTGNLSNPQADVGVASVASGTLIGYCTPERAPRFAGPNWLQGVSPTDCTATTGERAFVAIRYGNVVVIYTHLQPTLRVGETGSTVVINQLIGFTAPQTDGAHLHFEIRTYGVSAFNESDVPRHWINSWQYFDMSIQSIITQNWQNRKDIDGQVTGNPSEQITQCFSSPENPSENAPTTIIGIRIYGINPNNSSQENYREFRWVENGELKQYPLSPLQGSWRNYCMPQ